MSNELTVHKPTPVITAENVGVTTLKPVDTPKRRDIMKTPIEELSIEQLDERMNHRSNRSRGGGLFGKKDRPADWWACFHVRKRKSELSSADHELALMKKKAEHNRYKDEAARYEVSAVGMGARPEYRSAEEVL